MISSMTGYGRGEVSAEGITVAAEVRSVNNRFLEIQTRLPQSLALHENEVKELIRSKLSRGKVSLNVTLNNNNDGNIPLKINKTALRSYHKLLLEMKKSLKLKESIKLEHLLMFSEIFEPRDAEEENTIEWQIAQQAITKALEELAAMREKEGKELCNDLRLRIQWIEKVIDEVQTVNKQRIPQERLRLQERIKELLEDRSIIDEQRLEFELALLADKLDVTEECVRFRSHNKFFIELLENAEPAGRRMGFLLQEMNREANTIGAKVNDAAIQHKIVAVKEELEKIREQLQNIE
jgi:uncharacterized protein (TIGR00255 family)